MGSNGKGNGKTGDGGAAPPIQPEGKAPNGKAPSGAHAAEAEPPAAEAEALPREGTPEPDVPAAPPASSPTEEPEAVPAPSVATEGAPVRRGEAWGLPLAAFERRWTWLESRLITFVLVAQILSLVAWVFLNGLSESVTTTAGTVFRAVIARHRAGLRRLGRRPQAGREAAHATSRSRPSPRPSSWCSSGAAPRSRARAPRCRSTAPS